MASMEKNSDVKAAKHSMTKASGSFERTTRALAEHAGKTHGCEMKASVLHMQETTCTEPTVPEMPTRVQELKWNKEFESCIKKTE